VDPDFALTESNTPAVVQIWRRLDGLPLAIELAAARVGAFTATELACRLDRRFETLAGGRRRAVQRHQTLRAAIDWSYQLCSEAERRLLARLAVFAGGCSEEGAEEVCGTDPLAGWEVFELLAGLVAKSLVVAQRDSPASRYRLLETIRDYGEDRLAEFGETDQLRRRHAEFFCQLEAVLAERLGGPEELDTYRRWAAKRDNLLAAVDHAIDTAHVDLALRLVHYSPIPGFQLGFALCLPIPQILGLSGATSHDLYPYALALSALRAVGRGELDHIEDTCREALRATGRLSSSHARRRVEFLEAITQANRVQTLGWWRESVRYWGAGSQDCPRRRAGSRRGPIFRNHRQRLHNGRRPSGRG
jgi:hypothetical protein